MIKTTVDFNTDKGQGRDQQGERAGSRDNLSLPVGAAAEKSAQDQHERISLPDLMRLRKLNRPLRSL